MDPAQEQFKLNVDREIGRAVLSLIALRGRTQRDVGQALGLSEAQMSQRINGHASFKSYEIALLAHELQALPSAFYATVLEPDDEAGEVLSTPPGTRTRNLMILGPAPDEEAVDVA